MGWDEWREQAHLRQLELGIVSEGRRSRPDRLGPGVDDLDAPERAVAARFMECFAAFLSYTDTQLGRVLGFLEDLGSSTTRS